MRSANESGMCPATAGLALGSSSSSAVATGVTAQQVQRERGQYDSECEQPPARSHLRRLHVQFTGNGRHGWPQLRAAVFESVTTSRRSLVYLGVQQQHPQHALIFPEGCTTHAVIIASEHLSVNKVRKSILPWVQRILSVAEERGDVNLGAAPFEQGTKPPFRNLGKRKYRGKTLAALAAAVASSSTAGAAVQQATAIPADDDIAVVADRLKVQIICAAADAAPDAFVRTVAAVMRHQPAFACISTVATAQQQCMFTVHMGAQGDAMIDKAAVCSSIMDAVQSQNDDGQVFASICKWVDPLPEEYHHRAVYGLKAWGVSSASLSVGGPENCSKTFKLIGDSERWWWASHAV